MGQLVPINSGVEEYRQSTDAAGICRDIVLKTAKPIQGRKFVSVEGWQAIAVAHGCAAGARDVEKVDGGVRAIGEVRRMSDGQVIATAEGFVGEDEPVWFGGKERGKTYPKRADYAIRAMAQTRAISRACRSAFAHVVVMIDAGLSTTPAEEVPDGGFVDGQYEEVKQSRPSEPAKQAQSQSGMPDAEFAKLVQLVEATKTDRGWMLKHYQVKNLRLLDQAQYADAIKNLSDRLAEMAKSESNARARTAPATEFSDLTDADVPF